MFKRFLRMLLVHTIIFIDGIILTFFEKKIIIGYQLIVTDAKEDEKEKQILINYLKKCYKKPYKRNKNEA